MGFLPWSRKIGDALSVKAIRNGLVMAMPVLLIGSFSLVVLHLPFPVYREGLLRFADGLVVSFLSALVDATFGMLSLYVTVFIGLSRARLMPEKNGRLLAYPLVSLVSFALLSGFPAHPSALSSVGVSGMFTAILSALAATSLYEFWHRRGQRAFRLFSDGADVDFNNALSVVFPALLSVSTVALAALVIVRAFSVTGLQELFVDGTEALFAHIGQGLPLALSFVFASSGLWFFGIHGSNVLEGVAQRLLVPPLAINVASIAEGGLPTEIVSKTFIDVFVLMGGCGSALSLLLALVLFGRNGGSRTLSKIAFLPMLFNINEIMIFGLPVVYNVHLLVPFIVTPLVAALTSYGAMAIGVVPLPSQAVFWTTPVFLGGYVATGSVAGSLLQLFNLLLGVLIYRPFIALYEKETVRHAEEDLQGLVRLMGQSEASRVPLALTALEGRLGLFAKMIVADLQKAISEESLPLHYQPQFDSDGCCVGAEALLRWSFRSFGVLYPPLVIKLAEEGDCLFALERRVLRSAAKGGAVFRKELGRPFKVSANISAATFYHPDLECFLQELIDEGLVRRGELWLELTEQKALLFDEETEAKGRRIRAMGFPLVIDDFSMGHTSIRYLQQNEFDMVKLDGSFVRELEWNPRSAEIVASIVSLARSLNFTVLGECVETQEQKERLRDLGCTHYQGYLFSRALPLDDLLVELAGAERCRREEDPDESATTSD